MSLSEEERQQLEINEGHVRLLSLEHADDLISDLTQAPDACIRS